MGHVRQVQMSAVNRHGASMGFQLAQNSLNQLIPRPLHTQRVIPDHEFITHAVDKFGSHSDQSI
jgi:hypothetical protein